MPKPDVLYEVMLPELTRRRIEPTRQNCLDFLFGYKEVLEEAIEALDYESAVYRQFLFVKLEITRIETELQRQM